MFGLDGPLEWSQQPEPRRERTCGGVFGGGVCPGVDDLGTPVLSLVSSVAFLFLNMVVDNTTGCGTVTWRVSTSSSSSGGEAFGRGRRTVLVLAKRAEVRLPSLSLFLLCWRRPLEDQALGRIAVCGMLSIPVLSLLD